MEALKAKGNEAFKAKAFEDAIGHYSEVRLTGPSC